MKNFIIVLLTCSALYAQTSAVALYEESQKALSVGNIELAGEKMRSAIEADKSNEKFRAEFDKLNNLRNKRNNANRAVQDGRFDDAIQGFGDVLQSVPNSAESLYGTGKAYEGKKEFMTAVDFYKKSLQVDSGYDKSKKSISNVAKKLYNSANARSTSGSIIAVSTPLFADMQ